MSTNDFDEWIVSVDDHVIEPPDLWTSRLPAKYLGTCPQVVPDDEGEVWVYDGKRIRITGLVTRAGVDDAHLDPSPVTYAEMPPACFDPAARVEAMTRDGVAASMPFPNFPRFCGQEFYEARDHELGYLCIQAYNNFMLEEWCAAAPGRFIPLCIIPLWDPELAAREIKRCAAKGARAVSFSEHPPSLGLPSIHDAGQYWDPVFGAASDCGVVLAIHVGSSSTVPSTSPDAPSVVREILLTTVTSRTCVDWLVCGALARFPNLRLALSEGGIGWLPFVLRSVDRNLAHYQFHDRYEMIVEAVGMVTTRERDTVLEHWKHGSATAFEVFERHFRGCFIGGELGILARETVELLGDHLFMVEVDYPHADSTFPSSLATIDAMFADFPAPARRRLKSENAIDWFRMDRDLLARSLQETASAGNHVVK